MHCTCAHGLVTHEFCTLLALWAEADFVVHAMVSYPAVVCLPQGVAAAAFLNMATVLHVASRKVPFALALTAGIFLGLQVVAGLFKVKKLDEQEKLIMGVA